MSAWDFLSEGMAQFGTMQKEAEDSSSEPEGRTYLPSRI